MCAYCQHYDYGVSNGYYTGVTSDLENRLYEHQEGIPDSYTYTKRPIELVWNSDELDIQDAILLEKQIKGWSRAKKEALINECFSELKRLSVAYRDREEEC